MSCATLPSAGMPVTIGCYNSVPRRSLALLAALALILVGVAWWRSQGRSAAALVGTEAASPAERASSRLLPGAAATEAAGAAPAAGTGWPVPPRPHPAQRPRCTHRGP